MSETEVDYIDQSQWIPFKAIEQHVSSLVARGIKMWNGRSIIPDIKGMLPIDRLALARERGGEEILTESHKYAGHKFGAICACARGEPYPVVVEEEREPTRTDALIKKIVIEEQLQAMDKHLVRRIIIWQVYESDYAQFHRIAGNLCAAFDALELAMSKQNMQKALDDRHNRAMMPSFTRAQSASKI